MSRENRSAARAASARPAGPAPASTGPRKGQQELPVQAWRRLVLPVALGAAVAAATAAAHWTALDAAAVSFDDHEYLVNNSLVQNPSWDSARRFLTEVLNPSSVRGYYQPLNMISLMLDCAMGGTPEDLRPFHRTSLILHTANAGLVMVVLYLLFGNAWVAAAAALIFGVHPMTVETIPWIGERKTLLAAFFSLGSLVFYLRYARGGARERGAPGGVRPYRWAWMAASMAAYVLAVMSKPTAVLLPLVLLVMDYWPLGRMDRSPVLRAGRLSSAPPPLPKGFLWRMWELLVEKIPFFAILGASAVVTYISQGKLYTETRTPLQAVLIFCHNIVFYPRKMLWPVDLTSHYPVPDPLAIGTPAILVGVVGTVLLAAALIVSLRWTRSLVAGWAIFVAVIFPTMGVIGFSNVIASDKYAYLPALGLLMVLACFLDRLCRGRAAGGAEDHASKAGAARRPPEALASAAALVPAWRRVLIGAVVMALAFGEAVLTRRYLASWKDSITFYRYMLAYAPDDSVIQNNLGGFLEQRGDELLTKAGAEQAAGKREEGLADARQAVASLREAQVHLEEAIRLSPVMLGTHMNLGRAVYQEARAAFVIAAQESEKDPNDPAKFHEAQLAQERVGQARQEAEKLLLHSLALNPGDYRAAANMAEMVLDYDNGAMDLTIRWYQKSVEIYPQYIRSLLALASLLEIRGRPGDLAEAYRCLRMARAIRPGDQGIAKGLRDFDARHPNLR